MISGATAFSDRILRRQLAWREENYPALSDWDDDEVSRRFAHVFPRNKRELNFYPELHEWAVSISRDAFTAGEVVAELSNMLSPRVLALNMFAPFTGVGWWRPADGERAELARRFFAARCTGRVGRRLSISTLDPASITTSGSSTAGKRYPIGPTLSFTAVHSDGRRMLLTVLATFWERDMGRCPGRNERCYDPRQLARRGFVDCALESTSDYVGRNELEGMAARLRFAAAPRCPVADDLYRLFETQAMSTRRIAQSEQDAAPERVMVVLDERNHDLEAAVRRYCDAMGMNRPPVFTYQQWLRFVVAHDPVGSRDWVHWIRDRYFTVRGHTRPHGRS